MKHRCQENCAVLENVQIWGKYTVDIGSWECWTGLLKSCVAAVGMFDRRQRRENWLAIFFWIIAWTFTAIWNRWIVQQSGRADIFLAITFLCNCGMSFMNSDAKFGFPKLCKRCIFSYGRQCWIFLNSFRNLSERAIRKGTSQVTYNHFPNSYFKTASFDFYQNHKPQKICDLLTMKTCGHCVKVSPWTLGR